MHLDRKTRQQLIDALTPHVQGVAERRAILGAALHGTRLYHLIDIEGKPRNFASQLIVDSLNHGELDSGEPAILPVLYEIRERVGRDQKRAIDALMRQVQQAPREPISRDNPANRVFLSYRRANSTFIGRSVFQDLRAAGYDVFFDIEKLDSGNFPKIILRQIEARPHFVVILAPGSLDRCANPNDWLRREIEHAIDTGRNIIPLMFNGFEFSDYQHLLTGKLAALSDENAVRVPTEPEYFEEAMRRLRQFIQAARPVNVTATPRADESAVRQHMATATAEAEPTEAELQREAEMQRREQKLNAMQANLEKQMQEQQGNQRQLKRMWNDLQAAKAEMDARWEALEEREQQQREQAQRVREEKTRLERERQQLKRNQTQLEKQSVATPPKREQAQPESEHQQSRRKKPQPKPKKQPEPQPQPPPTNRYANYAPALVESVALAGVALVVVVLPRRTSMVCGVCGVCGVAVVCAVRCAGGWRRGLGVLFGVTSVVSFGVVGGVAFYVGLVVSFGVAFVVAFVVADYVVESIKNSQPNFVTRAIVPALALCYSVITWVVFTAPVNAGM